MSQQISTPRLTQVAPLLVDSTQRLLGYGAALATMIIWSGYFLSLRQGALSPLGTLELTLFRFAVPGFLLLPWFVARWPVIRQANPLWLTGIALGAGLPFFLLSAVAMGSAPVALGSTLIPGAAPLFVTGMAVWLFRQPFPRWRLYGLSLVVLGVGILVVAFSNTAQPMVLWAPAGFLACSALWALFTLCMRQSGLKPLDAAAVVTIPSTLLLLVFILFTRPTLDLTSVSTTEWMVQLAVQGLAVGLGAGYLYGYAINRLGAEATSAIGSFTPACASLMAWLWFEEPMSTSMFLALALVTFGVISASGLWRRAS